MEKTVQERWDTVFSEGKNFSLLNEFFLKEILTKVEEQNIVPRRVLDLGCGTGQSSILFARHGYEVTAVDVSTVALEKARERAHAEGVGDSALHFIQADLESLTDATLPGTFDIIHLKLVLAFIQNKEGLLSFIASILAQPGLVIVTSPILKEGVEYPQRLKSISIPEAELERLLRSHFTTVTLFHREFFEEQGIAHTYLASGKK